MGFPRSVLSALALLLAAAAPAGAADGATFGDTMVSNGKSVLAIWHSPRPPGMDLKARLVTAGGRPLGPARTIGISRSLLTGAPPLAAVWNPGRRRFLVAFGATGPSESARPCGMPPNCVQGDSEIYTRELDASGRPLGTARRVTRTGPASSLTDQAGRPSLVLDARHGSPLLAYLAVYDANARTALLTLPLRPDGRAAARPRAIVERARSTVNGGIHPLTGGGAVAIVSTSDNEYNAELVAQRLTRRGAARGRRRTLERLVGRLSEAYVAPQPRTGRTLVLWYRTEPVQMGPPTWRRALLARDGSPGRPDDFEVAHLAAHVSLAPDRRGWGALYTRWIAGNDVMFFRRLSEHGKRSGPEQRLTFHAPGGGGPNDDTFVGNPQIVSVGRRLLGAWFEEAEGGARRGVLRAL